MTRIEEGQDGKLGKEKEEEGNINKEERGNQQSVVTLEGFGVGIKEKTNDEAVYEVRGGDAEFTQKNKMTGKTLPPKWKI